MSRDLIESLKRDPGKPFIIAFMVTLAAAAVSLALEREDMANTLAEIAYYYLVIGVILQLVALVLEERRSRGDGGS